MTTESLKTRVKRLASLPFSKFLAVGVLNTVFGYSVFALFIVVGLHYVLAAFLATLCAIIFNFKTIGGLVFQNTDNRLILRFLGVYAVIFGLNVAWLTLGKHLGMHVLVAHALGVLPLAFVSYSFNRAFVFHRNRQEECRADSV